MELLAKLGVDWRLLIAQAINFGILLLILTIFVYRPLLSLLDERRERVRRAMEEAKRIELQAKEMEDLRQKELQKIDQEVGVLLEQGRREAETVRNETLAAAKREADALLTKARRELTEERARVFQEIEETLARMIVRVTEKVIEREFSAKDQERLLASLEKDIATQPR